MNAQAVQRPSQGHIIVHAAIWGGVMLAIHLFVVIGVGAGGGFRFSLVWPIILAVIAGATIGLGIGLPGMARGISMLSAAVVFLVLWLIFILTSMAGPGGGTAVFLITFFVLLAYIAFGGGRVLRRDYPESLAGRLLSIIGSAAAIVLLAITAVVVIIDLTSSREAMEIILNIILLVSALWLVAVMVVALINGIRRDPGSGLFAMLGVHLGLGLYVLTYVIMFIWLWAKTGHFEMIVPVLIILSSIPAVYVGAFGLGDMIRQILFRMGHAPAPQPQPAVAVAQPARPAPAVPAQTTEARLAKLKKLFEQGNISQEEYDQRRQQILGDL